MENDDKASMYSVKDLYYGVYKRIGILLYLIIITTGSVMVDYQRRGFEMAISNWSDDITLIVHYSESRVMNKRIN